MAKPRLEATFRLAREFDDGYDGVVVVKNNNTHAVRDWKVECELPIVNVTWSSPNVECAPASVTVTFEPKPWAKTLQPGECVQVEFGGRMRAVPKTVRAVQLVPVPPRDDSHANRATLGAKVLAPYVDMRVYPPPNLEELAGGDVHRVFTLAYVTSCGGVPAWAGVVTTDTLYMADQIRALRVAGGDVIVSFGGPDGPDLAEDVACPRELSKLFESVTDAYDARWIECAPYGSALAAEAVQTRNAALARFQKRRPGVVVSYALPATPTGLTADAVDVLRDAARAGVRVDVVTVLAQNFGDEAAPNPSGYMARYVRQSVLNSRAKVAECFAHATLGVCPMIGVNDVASEVFGLEEAEAIAQFASDLGWIRHVSYWNANRDVDDGRRDSNFGSSGVAQAPRQFLRTFATCVAS